ncbi:MAG: hypothetical protein WD401_06090 [Thermomicrobiaceae bacterium]
MTGQHKANPLRSRLTQVLVTLVFAGVAVGTVSMLPVHHTESTPFASPAFQRTWISEAEAATQGVDLWGSDPLAWRVEPYAGAPDDRRIVQYFDRGRMEVEAGSSRVTLGLLAHEMTSGEIDLGSGVREERQSPEISIDSGSPDESVPTYLTLSRFVGEMATDRSVGDERLTDWINREGRIDQSATPEVVNVDEYIEESGHNLPDVTAELFERPEFQNERWVESFGYPISEPFWTQYRRADQMLPSLVQVFERRILVYTPKLEPSDSFTVASTGRHYSLWRYGTEPHPDTVEPPENASDPGLVLGDDLHAWEYANDIDTPIDLTLAPSGHLLILTAEGEILKADSVDPDGNPSGFTLWAEGIEEPQGMATHGGSVLVTASDRIQWFHEVDGVAISGQSPDLESESTVRAAVRGKPVADGSGSVFARSGYSPSTNVVREIGSEKPVVRLDSLLSDPGPITFSGNDLVMSGVNEDGRTEVLLIPSVPGNVQSGSAIHLATFPRGSEVRALVAADESRWPVSELGEVVAAVETDGGTGIFALSRQTASGETEVIELASGLSRPTALEVGLDGSIYVADAGQGRIIKIRYDG